MSPNCYTAAQIAAAYAMLDTREEWSSIDAACWLSVKGRLSVALGEDFEGYSREQFQRLCEHVIAGER
jgi:hypothetical protein